MKNKDGLWRISPSGLYEYSACKSCFWVDNTYKKTPSIPPVLNQAMDSILKARYDKYRAKGTFPPEVRELDDEGIKPFEGLEQLNEWRENKNALSVIDEKAGYLLTGKIDDVLIESDGRLIPADYKSSGNAPGEDKKKYYIDQLAAYGFMFNKHGHKVSDRAYLLHYFVKDRNDPSNKVEFDSHVDLVKIDIKALEKKLADIVVLLNGPYPGHNPGCDKCSYFDKRESVTK